MSSVCFVSYFASSVLFDSGEKIVGGAEVQQSILATELHKRGVRVCFVVADQLETAAASHPDFAVYRSYRRLSGLRLIRFFYPQLVKTWMAMKRADCEIYYVRGTMVECIFTWLFCEVRHRKLVLAIASDDECGKARFPWRRGNPKRWLSFLAIKRAFRVLAQSEWQRDSLLSSFGIDAEVLRNVVPLVRAGRKSTGRFRRLLWVGSIVRSKRPELFLDLAERFKDLEFVMIGPVRLGDENYHDGIVQRAARIPNVTFLDFVPPSKIVSFFLEADALLLTSKYEGFPNVLLQAWSCACPVITSFDPDGVVDQFGLGFVTIEAGEFENLIEEIRLGQRNGEIARMGNNGYAYVEKLHSPTVVMHQLKESLELVFR